MANIDTDFDPEDEAEDSLDAPPASAARGFEQFVRDNPTAAVVGALMVGVILGRIGIL